MDYINIKEEYIKWLSEKIEVVDQDEYSIVKTPFLNHNNDHIEFYLEKVDSDYLLTDGGNTLNEMELQGIDILSSPSKLKIFNHFIKGYGVLFNEDTKEISIRTSLSRLALSKHMFLQCLMSVSDMFILSRPALKSMFLEEVIQFFNEKEIGYSEQICLTGKSGLTHAFNFLMNKTKTRPELIVSVINHVDKNNILNQLFYFNDILEQRVESRGMIIYNDEKKPIQQELEQACKTYSVTPIAFSTLKQDYKTIFYN